MDAGDIFCTWLHCDRPVRYWRASNLTTRGYECEVKTELIYIVGEYICRCFLIVKDVRVSLLYWQYHGHLWKGPRNGHSLYKCATGHLVPFTAPYGPCRLQQSVAVSRWAQVEGRLLYPEKLCF
jgi:hypothetical protein